MEPVLINLNDYVRTGEGANGASYDSKTDSNVMIKLYNEGYETKMIITELEVAQKVWKLGIPSPEPGELVTDGKRIGIRFKRLVNKKSFCRAIADEPHRIDELSREFAQMCKQLHQIKCDKSGLPNVKEQFLYFLSCDTAFNKAEKEIIAKYINAVPDTGTAVHGDLHFGNAVTTGDKHYFIDLGCFAHGHPYFDLGMMYIVTHLNEESFTLENFHINKPTAYKIWTIFVDEYFEHKLSVEEAEDLIKPFAAIKSLLVEHNCGDVLFPHFEKVFRETILK